MLDAATAQWMRWRNSEVFDSVFNTYWNVPWLMYYLKEHGLMASAEDEAEDTTAKTD